MENAIIIRYCEIHLKGKNRGYFEKMLKENIKRSLKGINFTFTTMHSRYLIENFDENDYDLITEKLQKIAGIHTYSRALVVNSNMDDIFNAAKLLCEDKEGTFKVATNRADKTFTPSSMETSMILGGRLLEAFGGKFKVKVKEINIIFNFK